MSSGKEELKNKLKTIIKHQQAPVNTAALLSAILNKVEQERSEIGYKDPNFLIELRGFRKVSN